MLHIVTGAPCAGKTTFVNDHKADGDVVVDLDAIAEALGSSNRYEYSGGIKKAAFAARDAAISSITEDVDAWVIHSRPTKEQREAYKNAVFHDLDPGKAVCIERARKDGRPKKTVEAIESFYGESGRSWPFQYKPDEKSGTHQQPRKAAFLMPEKGKLGEVMADETKTNAQTAEPQATETDWQSKYEEMRGHMRDWEKKAKANQSAADELEKLKAEQMTEQEKANARAEAAEAELAHLKAEKERTDAAQRIAAESGVPIELLMYCADEDAMKSFKKAYEKATHAPSAPSALIGSRIVKDNEQTSTSKAFSEFAREFFNK